MLSVIRDYLSDIKFMVEEALFVVFGEVIYDIGVKRIIIAVVLIGLAVCAVFIYRYLRSRFTARLGKLDRIAMGVEENSRMLRRLLAEKSSGAPDDVSEAGG